jgi:hypothetical protein
MFKKISRFTWIYDVWLVGYKHGLEVGSSPHSIDYLDALFQNPILYVEPTFPSCLNIGRLHYSSTHQYFNSFMSFLINKFIFYVVVIKVKNQNGKGGGLQSS